MSKDLKIIYDRMMFFILDYIKLRNVIFEELFFEFEGSLMGGGRCFIFFFNIED